MEGCSDAVPVGRADGDDDDWYDGQAIPLKRLGWSCEGKS